MGKAGQALRQVLESYNISQSLLATGLGVERPIVFRWFHEHTDPTAETLSEIVQALNKINTSAATDFGQAYLGNLITAAKNSTPDLPKSDRVNVSALSQIFDNTTTSYKHLFFISILDILRRRKFDTLSPISFREIIVEMLANAWYPHSYFKLSFRVQDKIAAKLDTLVLEITEPILKFTDTDKKLLRKTIQSQNIDDIISFISRYVHFSTQKLRAKRMFGKCKKAPKKKSSLDLLGWIKFLRLTSDRGSYDSSLHHRTDDRTV
jgi:transcriptional regulator with XRE-family HTH domain